MKQLLFLLIGTVIIYFHAYAGNFIRTDDGIIVYPEAPFGGNAQQVYVRVITENIFRITATADSSLVPDKSLIILPQKFPVVKFELIETSDWVELKTSALTIKVDLLTGNITYADASGNQLLSEKKLSRQLEPMVFDGEKLYSIHQQFITNKDDAWYGLGQHQDGLMNYKGYQVQLFQNNTEVAMPFLVSKNNYGILWDNYSLTKVGDVRDYLPLHALKLFSKSNELGWLTASYSNDKNKPADVAISRAESEISYEFLNDSKLFLPKEFEPGNGVVTWEGSLSSEWSGEHKFRFTYGGYIKVWLNDQLVLDRWRVAWNPGSAVLAIDFDNAEKKKIKIEWIPDGGESYISLKWLPPLQETGENGFGFLSEAGQYLDYYFIHGADMDCVIAGYRLLTGKATLLPKWAFGKWQSRERYKTQEEVLETVKEFRRRKIPLDNIVQDWSYWKEKEWGSQDFDTTRFPDVTRLINTLHKQYHTRFMISVWPKFYEDIPAYNDFRKKGWLYMRNIADRQRDWIGQGYVSTFYDAFNEEAQKGFWELLDKKLYSKGVDAWWMDASEPDILSNVTPQQRKEQMTPTALGPAAQYLNAYPLVNAKGIYEGQRNTNPGDRVFILTRSAFAGQQRYGAATWSGDIASRWHDMMLQISAGVNFSMSGIPWWSMDIGGFAVENRFAKPNDKDLDEWRELNTRWYQFGAFVPLFRVHGQYPFREIYNIAPEDHPAYKSMLYYDKLRYHLMPYIYSLAGEAYHNNGTMMRGLVMDFPGDTAVINTNDQYLFGRSLLINPVYNYQQQSREVYLPKHSGWYNLYNGKFETGGKKINAEAPYERMPVFVKAGSILPFGPEMQYTSEKPADEITLYVYTGSDGAFTLYEDEGTNYNYEKNAFATIAMLYNEATKTLTIGERKGSFDGMLQQRKFHVVWVSRDHAIGIDSKNYNRETVIYKGSPVSIRKK